MLLLMFGGLSLFNIELPDIWANTRDEYTAGVLSPMRVTTLIMIKVKKKMSEGSISKQLNLKSDMTCHLSACHKKITYTPNLLCCIDDCNFRRNTKSHLKAFPHHFLHLPNSIHRSNWVDISWRQNSYVRHQKQELICYSSLKSWTDRHSQV